MSSIDVPETLKEKLIQAALRRGYVEQRDQDPQIADFLAYLLRLDDAIGHEDGVIGEEMRRRSSLSSVLGSLIKEGQEAPSDEVIDRILEERRMRH